MSSPQAAVVATAPAPKVQYPFWYGGALLMFACLFTHPLDLAKVRLQTAAKPGDNLIRVVYRIVTQEGPLKVYSGLTASLLRQGTYSTARFGVYEGLKEYFSKDGVQPSTLVLLPCSMAAGAIGGLVGNPLDVVNIRMQNDSSLPALQRRNYRNAFDGLFRIVREEGVGLLFRGLNPNLVRGVLMTASQVVTYDIAKLLLVDQAGMDPTTKATHFSASLLAGLVATTVCLPADVVKTRIMNSKEKGASAVSIIKHAVGTEGVGFLFRGWTPAFIRLGPHTIVTFLALEQLREMKIGM